MGRSARAAADCRPASRSCPAGSKYASVFAPGSREPGAKWSAIRAGPHVAGAVHDVALVRGQDGVNSPGGGRARPGPPDVDVYVLTGRTPSACRSLLTPGTPGEPSTPRLSAFSVAPRRVCALRSFGVAIYRSAASTPELLHSRFRTARVIRTAREAKTTRKPTKIRSSTRPSWW
jgi:hypothetical protein